MTARLELTRAPPQPRPGSHDLTVGPSRGVGRDPRVANAVVQVGLVGADDLIHHGLRGMLSPYAGRAQLVPSEGLWPSTVDVLLVDPRHDARSGDGVRRLVAEGYERVVAFGWDESAAERGVLLAAGAREYLPMQLGAGELVRRLELLAHSRVTAPRHASTARPPPSSPLMAHGLTPREAQVITLIARGMTNKEIAAELYLGLNTIKSYVRGAYRKMDVVRRSQAVAWVIERGA